MRLHPHQKKIASSPARFKVIRGGRRGGKTMLEIENMAFKAVSKKDRQIFYVAPTQDQARDIIWEGLKSRLGGIGDSNETRLEMKVPTQDGGTSLIRIAGWENRERFRGKYADHITIDETDTMKNFFIGWEEIFKPALMDKAGSADFIGTPQKENPNLRRLEKYAEDKDDWECFHFTSWENPSIAREELRKMEKETDSNTYKQEIMAEYVDHLGALFRYASLVDMFSNTVEKSAEAYMTVDVADDGSDKTVFTMWEGLECYRIERFERLNTESIISHIKDYAAEDQIPYSQIAVDAIGVGAGVASSSLLDGIVAFKSSHGAMKTDQDPVRLPNVHYTKDAPLISEYRNLRSQCVFTLAELVNNHKIAIKAEDVRVKEAIIEELQLYQDASKGDGKRYATAKEDIVALLGHSPDITDAIIMRMYFHLREKLQPYQSEEKARVASIMESQFAQAEANAVANNTR